MKAVRSPLLGRAGAPSRRTAIMTIATAILAGLLCGHGSALAGKEVMLDGVLHVQNGATPRDGVETLHLKEVWRAGGEDSEVLFGIIARALCDDAGNIYLLDTQLSEVQVFSPAGEFLRTLSREGDGPGESRNPRDMVFMSDGTLGLVQQFPGKFIKVDLNDNPAGNLPLGGDPTQGGFLMLIDARAAGDHLYLSGTQVTQNNEQGTQDRVAFIASFDPDGKELVRFYESKSTLVFSKLAFSETDLFQVWSRWGITNDGKVLVPVPRNGYAIEVHRPDGTLERIIQREYKSWTREAADRRLIDGIMDAIGRQVPIEFEKIVEETEPDIAQIQGLEDGTIWVATSRGQRHQPDGIMQTMDVFDATGEFIKQVAIACEGSGTNDGLFFLGNGRAILVKGIIDAVLMQMGGSGAAAAGEEEEPTPMEVICYAME
jgi:hypothetical protein